ncbi:hypothetical protein [Kutzneria sp. NPDC051319]|uniref:hypothetical protein n=1 Tax=Kutzneria sp. NPDC051319 TaxID=3155047 RepID=UPI003435DD1E
MRGLIVKLAIVAAVTGSIVWLVWPRGAGTDQTDRQARAIADAISYPRQADAMGYAHAVLALNHAGAQVMEATDLHQKDLKAPQVHLVIQLRYTDCDKPTIFGCGGREINRTVCYGFDLTYYAVVNGPSVVDCP